MEPSLIRAASHHLLGNGYAVESADAIGRFSDGTFTTTEVARAIGADKNVVATALARFEKAGLIKRCPRAGRDQPYERIRSTYWALCAELLAELRGR